MQIGPQHFFILINKLSIQSLKIFQFKPTFSFVLELNIFMQRGPSYLMYFAIIS